MINDDNNVEEVENQRENNNKNKIDKYSTFLIIMIGIMFSTALIIFSMIFGKIYATANSVNMKKDVSNMKVRVEELSKENTEYKGQIQEYIRNEKNAEELETKLAEALDENNKITEENEDLTKRKIWLANEVDRLTKEVEKLSAENETLTYINNKNSNLTRYETENITNIVNILNGTTVANGETLSLKDIIYRNNSRYNYDVYGDNPGYINGVEFVANAVYNSSLKNGVDIISYHKNSNDFIDITPDYDLKIQNNTESMFMIRCSYTNNIVNVSMIKLN